MALQIFHICLLVSYNYHMIAVREQCYLESSGSDLIFMIRTAALAEPDLESYTIRLPV
jgi:hypothetical protein